jgi:hypothetical protein
MVSCDYVLHHYLVQMINYGKKVPLYIASLCSLPLASSCPDKSSYCLIVRSRNAILPENQTKVKRVDTLPIMGVP